MSSNPKKYILTIIISILIFTPFLSFAADKSFYQNCDPSKSLEECLKENYQDVTGQEYVEVTSLSLSTKIGIIISYILAFLGVIFLVLIITSGYQWLTAGGSEEKVSAARKRIINAVIGLVIILLAYIVTAFATNRIETSLEKANTSTTTPLQ